MLKANLTEESVISHTDYIHQSVTSSNDSDANKQTNKIYLAFMLRNKKLQRRVTLENL